MSSHKISLFYSNLCITAAFLLTSPDAFPQSNSNTVTVSPAGMRGEMPTIDPASSVSSALISVEVAEGSAPVEAATVSAPQVAEPSNVVLDAHPSDQTAALILPRPSIPLPADSALGSEHGIAMVKTAIKVVPEPTEIDTTEGFERKIDIGEIETSAGTFGDPSRYMQMLPGIVSDNDKFNDFIVRGGNPEETLFIVDNIEMPSINQLALSDTTGGFVSMIDNAAIKQINLHTDAYDSKYDQRLSAVVEISTKKEQASAAHSESEIGLAGAGGSTSKPWGSNGSMFFSARRSILNLVTNNIGMNGVPIYTNSLFRADKRVDDRNSFWGLSLTGVDSMDILPDRKDPGETNAYNIAYKGWRNTSGMNWQHIFSKNSFGVASLANSEQSQSLVENAQMLSGATVYSEDTRDGITTAKYDETLQAKPWLTITAGVRTAVDRLNYTVDQPLGLQNPYSSNPSPMNAMSLNRKFSTFSSAGYSQAAFLLPRGVKVVVGERISQWAILGSTIWTPKVLVMFPVVGRTMHVGYAQYAQLPPSLYILSFNNQSSLKPIRSEHLTWGLDVFQSSRARVTVEAYQKRYMDYPVAVDYPQLSLANVADTFGQTFLMFPMTSKGSGLARGVELALDSKPFSRFTLTSAVTYSRSWYSGLDGVLRRGNFDLPLVANVAGNMALKGTMVLSFRYSGASGKPYTPDNLLLSAAQNRDVYDLSKINASRAPAYSRLDFRLEQSFPIRKGVFTWHMGMENVLGTSNFYSYEWTSHSTPGSLITQTQMPRFPDGGVKFSF